jgi:5-methylcytosine-specific restriction protein A
VKLWQNLRASRASTALKKPGSRPTVAKQFTRNANVAEYAVRRANGVCELCEASAPFEDNQGKPFLEVHHIVWLSKEGEDTIDNVAALCPNCHRRMHILDKKDDIRKLTDQRNSEAIHR